MPEWLSKEENYIAEADRDTFVNKSILSLLGVLSRIKAQSEYEKDSFNISASLKVIFTFMLVLLISFSKSFAFIIVANIYLLLILSMMKGEEILKIIKVSLVVTAFTFVILLPSVFLRNGTRSFIIAIKVFPTVNCVSILSHSTRWNHITGALKKFFIPDIFILVLDITIRYIVMLGEFSVNMLYSLKLRSVGKNKSKYTSLSGIAGTMFIKSKEMAEDMYLAMECRGFTGEYKVINRKYKFKLGDFIFIIINIMIFTAFLYMERI